MKYGDLIFTRKELINGEWFSSKKSIYDIWPGFPAYVLEGDNEEEIISNSISEIIEVMGENCLFAEFVDGQVMIHNCDEEATVEEVFCDFSLVK